MTSGQSWLALPLRTERPFTRRTLLDQEGCWVGRAIGRVGFPFGLGCWAGPAGFRVEPMVRRLTGNASVGALAESHWPIGVAAVTACGACSGQGFLPIMSCAHASLSGLLWESPCAAHSWSRWSWEKSFSPAGGAGPWALPSTVCWAGE